MEAGKGKRVGYLSLVWELLLVCEGEVARGELAALVLFVGEATFEAEESQLSQPSWS